MITTPTRISTSSNKSRSMPRTAPSPTSVYFVVVVVVVVVVGFCFVALIQLKQLRSAWISWATFSTKESDAVAREAVKVPTPISIGFFRNTDFNRVFP